MISKAKKKARDEVLAALRRGVTICTHIRVDLLTVTERLDRIKAIAQLRAMEGAVVRAKTDEDVTNALGAVKELLDEEYQKHVE